MFVLLSAAHKIPHRSTLSALQITSDIVREFVCTSSALPLSESVFELGLVDGDSEGETLDKLLGEPLDEFDGEALDELDGIILVEELGKSEGRADEKLDVAGDAVGSAEIVGDGVGLSDGICDGS